MRAGSKAILWGLALAFCFSVPTSVASPLDNWSWLNPRPQANTLNSVTYGVGQFVAVGNRGVIVTSTNGFDWTVSPSGISTSIRGVTYHSGKFVAVGDAGAILVSTNATEWTQQISPTTNTLRAVGGNSTKLLAVGDAGTALDSLNGLSWQARPPGVVTRLNAVASSGLGITVVGEHGTVLRYLAPTGNWQAYAPGFTYDLYAVAFGLALTVAGGNTGVYIPPNGGTQNSVLYSGNFTTWGAQTFSGSWGNTPGLWFPSDLFCLRGMTFGGNKFVAVGDTGQTLERNYPGVILTSDDGMNWIELSPYSSENSLCGVTYGGGLYVAVGEAGAILVSSNAQQWIEATPYHRSAITAIARNEKLFVASANPARHYYWNFPDFTSLVSSNGVDWTVATTNLPWMTGLATSEDVFVGIAGNCAYTSTNGFNWTSNCFSASALRDVSRAKGLFFAVGDTGSIYTSPDGSAWTNHSSPAFGTLNAASFGNGLFVAAGTSVVTSTNGIAWSVYSSNPPVKLTKIAYGNGTFIAAGEDGPVYLPSRKLLSSQDGLRWTIRYSISNDFPYAVQLGYGNGTFLAVAGSTILWSADGISWIKSNASTPLYDSSWWVYYSTYPKDVPPAICFDQGTFIIGGMDGILMRSGDIRVPILANSIRKTGLGFMFDFVPQLDESYRIQTTTDLQLWQNIYSANGKTQPTRFIDFTPNISSKRFFRVVSP